MWVSSQGSGTVSRIDPHTDTAVAEIDIRGAFEGGDLAAGDGVAWAATGYGPLTVIDQSTNEVLEQWERHGADVIALGDGSAWISDHDLETVYRYTPLAGEDARGRAAEQLGVQEKAAVDLAATWSEDDESAAAMTPPVALRQVCNSTSDTHAGDVSVRTGRATSPQ